MFLLKNNFIFFLILIFSMALYGNEQGFYEEYTTTGTSLDPHQENCAQEITISREEQLIEHVKKSIQFAEQGSSKLSQEVLAVPGMTSHKIKHFLNNVCSLAKIRYLEIGVWKGSTFTAALYENQSSIVHAIAIDNWSEFGGPQEEFKKNCQAFINSASYQFYNHDSFTFNKELVQEPIDIYFYDGNHSEKSQELAFTYYDSLLAPVFIAIVDDWNWPAVQKGTKKAFDRLNYTVLFERALPASKLGSDRKQWWNGLYVAVIKRNNA